LDAVIALEQRRHFLARGAEQFRDLEYPDSCQTLALWLLFARLGGRRRLRPHRRQDFFRSLLADARQLRQDFGGRRSERLDRRESALDQPANRLVADACERVRRRRFRGLRGLARLRLRGSGLSGRFRRSGFARDLEVAELRLDLAALLFLALDVDAPAGELGGEPDVLPLLADRQRQLLVFDDHFHHPVLVVDDRHALHLRRAEAVGDEGNRVLGPFDDVDLLAAELADDRLHAGALHADAGADRVDVALARHHRDLGAVARFAHRAADHHRAVVDLRHFLLEQLDQQRRVGARQHDLRTLGAAVDPFDHGADAVARGVTLGARLLLARQHRFDAADLEDDVPVLEALHGAVDHLADPLVVLGEDVLPLGLADFLEDHLLGGLRGDPPQHFGGLRELHLVAELDAVGDLVAVDRAVHLARFGERDLGGGRGDLFDDRLEGEEIDLAGLGVEPRFQVLARLVVLARRGGNRFLDRADDDVGLDPLLLGQRFDGLLQRIRHISYP